jgi:methylmalonyl-CoA mutase, N-terminal domain
MNFQDALEKWNKEILWPSINRFPERKEVFMTGSNIEIPRVALPTEQINFDEIGFPGSYPFTRGIQPTMYRGRLWTMRQYAGYASAKESNQRYRYLLDQGQTGLSVAFDLPTQIGYDADDPISTGEVGKVGVSVSTIEDMEQLFEDIPLENVSVSMTINAPAAILLAMYIAIARRRGIDGGKLRGTIQNDILKEYIARGTYIFPPDPSMRLITDIFAYCQEYLPYWNTISISGYHIREAGATAVQEVAFTFANAIAYIEAALKTGLKIDQFASQMSFFFNAHNNFFEEVAKYRAARRLWAKIMRERFNAQESKSCMLRFHTQTAGSTLTAQQPENNIVRVAFQALAAVLGGTQSLHTNSMDEALWLPTENAVRIALKTQQIIAFETGVADSVDPLGGSYLVEQLTNQIESDAENYIEKIDALGGAQKSIQYGYMQKEIQDASYLSQKAIESGDQMVIGVNSYMIPEEFKLENLGVNESVEKEQLERLGKNREARNQEMVSGLLKILENEAKGRENLMPILIECVENRVTLGEICNVLRGVWGEYHSPDWT